LEDHVSDEQSAKTHAADTTPSDLQQNAGGSRARKSSARKGFTSAQRTEAMGSVAYGKTVSQAAKDFGISDGLLYQWIRDNSDEYAEMCRAAWKASMVRFPELCAKAMAIVAEKMDKLDAFSAAKVLNEILAAWEKGKAIDAAPDGSTGQGAARPSSPLADAIRAIGDALRSQRGPA
jgi:hypothetical protein